MTSKDTKTFDIFADEDYGNSEPVRIYNKDLGRTHTPASVYFMEGNRVFHHIVDRTMENLT